MRMLARRLLALLLVILLGNVGLSLVAAQVATQPPVIADSRPVHGFADTIISPANSLRNYDAAGQPKQLWFVPGAGHSASRGVAGAPYAHRVVAFFRRYLR